VRNVLPPTTIEARGPANVVPEEATVTFACSVLPGVSKDDLEAELRAALGDGDYELEVGELQGGSTSPPESRLRDAIAAFLADADPEATLLPALGYGYSDCDAFREAYGTIAAGFIPFRHADALTNLLTKHGADERVLIDDLVFQARCAASVAAAICGAP
jgi:acetylornithine deacetylase/succinyl-diaminopimelate desuccinylase-like protein